MAKRWRWKRCRLAALATCRGCQFQLYKELELLSTQVNFALVWTTETVKWKSMQKWSEQGATIKPYQHEGHSGKWCWSHLCNYIHNLTSPWELGCLRKIQIPIGKREASEDILAAHCAGLPECEACGDQRGDIFPVTKHATSTKICIREEKCLDCSRAG